MNKEIKLGYTTIQHEPRIRFGLTNNDYCIASIIYHLSNNPKAPVPGWCSAPKEDIGTFIGISRQAVHTIVNKLIAKGLVEKQEETGFLRTTSLWYENMECFTVCKESLHTVKNVDEKTEESALHSVKKVDTGCKESLHYNNIYNNNTISNTSLVPATAGDEVSGENFSQNLTEKNSESQNLPLDESKNPKEKSSAKKEKVRVLISQVPMPTEKTEENVCLRLSKWMHTEFTKISPKSKTLKEAKLETWVNDARLLLEVDKRPIADVTKVFSFAINDSFWSTTIQSISSFREHYDQLELKMQRPVKTAQNKDAPLVVKNIATGSEEERRRKREAGEYD